MNKSGVIGQYALLFGGPLGAAILAKQIVNSQVGQAAGSKPPADKPALGDLVANDSGNTDLGDLQYVLFNGVALVFVLVNLLHHPINGLPHIPEVLLGLTSVSAVGYVSKKALTPTEAIKAKLDPGAGPVGQAVAIRLQGLSAPDQQAVPFWVRFNKEATGLLVPADVAEGKADVPRTAPPPQPGAGKKVDVTVTTVDGTVIDAGEFEYT
jgi:hypothetical protein